MGVRSRSSIRLARGLAWSKRMIRPARGRRGAPIVGWVIAIIAVAAVVVALGG